MFQDKKMIKWIIILPIIIFFFSSTIKIKQGMCSSSPCGDLNSSEMVSKNGYYDTFVKSNTNFYLAPTFLLLKYFFHEDNYKINRDEVGVFSSFDFDTIKDSDYGNLVKIRNYYFNVDNTSFVKEFFLIKFIIFLSFPIWILISFIFYKTYSLNKIIGVILLSIFFISFGFLKLIYIFDPFDNDGGNITFKHLIFMERK